MNPSYTYVATPAALQAFLTRLAAAPRVSLDIEADSLHHYYEKVCLIQLSFSGENVILDPLAKLELADFARVLAARPLIFHDGGYDLRMLRRSLAFRPAAPVFDTLLAAQLLGYEQLGLAALAQRYRNVDLPKHGKKSDWSYRPLSPDLLAYACNDTCHLEYIADQLTAELQRLGRLDWLWQASEAMIRATAVDKPERDADTIWRIAGAQSLDRRELAILREIWHWREKEAQKADVPPFKIIGNHQIIDLALWAGKHYDPGAPADPPKLPRHCTGRRLAALHLALRRAEELSPDEWPEVRRREPPQPSGPLFNALRAQCNDLAARFGIAPTVLASRALLEAIGQARPQTLDELLAAGPVMPWQAELLLPVVKKVLADAQELDR